MNYFSYPLTIVQTNIFEEPQNIFSQPKSQTPNYRARPPVFLTIECPPGANLKAIRYESTSLNRIVADKLHHVIVAYFITVITQLPWQP